MNTEKINEKIENEVSKFLPSKNQRQEGSYAVCECHQEIPCNLCVTSCPTGAITQETINSTPDIDFDQCVGCRECVTACPGLACFVIDETYSETQALLHIPYEFLPLPEEGDIVQGLDRKGNEVTEVEVKRVDDRETLNGSNVVTLITPKEKVHQIRNIKLLGGKRG